MFSFYLFLKLESFQRSRRLPYLTGAAICHEEGNQGAKEKDQDQKDEDSYEAEIYTKYIQEAKADFNNNILSAVKARSRKAVGDVVT